MAKRPPVKLGPGIYRDDEGIVVDVPELCKHFHLDDTKTNRERCLRLALRAADQVFPDGTKILVRREGQTLRVSAHLASHQTG